MPDWAIASLSELIEAAHWEELNRRFHQTLSFGTGGMRGRTIGQQITRSEAGKTNLGSVPAHPSVGTAYFNDFNLIWATIGLYRYCAQKQANQTPQLVIAHDVRLFSRHFCELTASTWAQLGGRAQIFAQARSTPQLSFAVRHLKADAGVMITASHNPPHDNGYKVYFADGGQIVPPHSDGILQAIDAVPLAAISPFLNLNLAAVETLDLSLDQAYLETVANALEPITIGEKRKQRKRDNTTAVLRVLFTPLHGVGAVASIPLMENAGVQVLPLAQQMMQDGNFPTVQLPNPEHPEAFTLAIEQAKHTQADLALATDSDADRLGVAAPNDQGEWILLTGNQLGSLLLSFRLNQLTSAGLLPPEGSQSIALIKTFVSTPFADLIAQKHKIKTINTLTGFKWAGAKLLAYEQKLCQEYQRQYGTPLDYGALSAVERRSLLIRHSTYCLLAFEESYGLLACDAVRDKDANAATLLTCQLAVHLRDKG